MIFIDNKSEMSKLCFQPLVLIQFSKIYSLLAY